VAEVGLPAGYRGKHLGQTERMRDSVDSVQFATIAGTIPVALATGGDAFRQPMDILVIGGLVFSVPAA